MPSRQRLTVGLVVLVSLTACQSAPAADAPASAPPPDRPSPTVAIAPTPSPVPHPILGDGRVRQAIVHCTGRAGLLRSVYPWLTDTAPFEAVSILPLADLPLAEGLPADAFSPEQGRALLEEAGWALASGAVYRTNADGAELALTLTTTDAAFRRSWAAAWEEQLKACGLRLRRQHIPAAQFFGDDAGLRRREFEIAAFTWTADDDSGGLKAYARLACDQVPSPANGWQGQNYAGWCNPAAEAALAVVTGRPGEAERRAAYQTLQSEYAREAPGLPLFYRVSVLAVDPALENFEPTDDGLHTWNAAQWRLPGQDTLVIGEDAEPAALHWFEPGYVAGVIRTLVTGRDVIQRQSEYQPVLLKRLPTLENGGAVEARVTVKAGDSVVDWAGEAATLQPGVWMRDAEGRKVVYDGGELSVRQLVVTYEFVDGLTWSDGAPVSRADYELAYRAMCDPAVRGAGPFSAARPDPFPACDEIAGVEFLGDAAYRVTWKPGFSGARLNGRDRPYFLPPFSRVPAHQVLDDGRRLAAAPPAQWFQSDAVMRRPLGVGPYVVQAWVNGQSLTLTANPHYFQGPPATPRIVVRFLEHDRAIRALLAGEVDVLDWETLGPDDVEAFQLMPAQAAGQVRLILAPASAWEQLDFALFLR